MSNFQTLFAEARSLLLPYRQPEEGSILCSAPQTDVCRSELHSILAGNRLIHSAAESCWRKNHGLHSILAYLVAELLADRVLSCAHSCSELPCQVPALHF